MPEQGEIFLRECGDGGKYFLHTVRRTQMQKDYNWPEMKKNGTDSRAEDILHQRGISDL